MPDDVNVIPTFSFQLTPSRRATTLADVKNQIDGISTHALTEGDFLRFSSFSAHRISTHALTEGDSQPMDSRSSSRLFQLTPSRRATYTAHCPPPDRKFQLTPSRRATTIIGLIGMMKFISTHALTEGDIFLSHFHQSGRISTHALTEGDVNKWLLWMEL